MTIVELEELLQTNNTSIKEILYQNILIIDGMAKQLGMIYKITPDTIITEYWKKAKEIKVKDIEIDTVIKEALIPF